MNETHATQTMSASRPSGDPVAAARLESEISELRRANAHLRRRLEEAEVQADFRIRADRLLALPLSDTR